MKLTSVETNDAAGAILAHGQRLGPAAMLKKGRRLSREDCAALENAGIRRVTVAVLDEDDVTEDDAARRIAEAIAGTRVDVAPAATGRANLFAASRGVVVTSRDRIDALNALDEGITLATVEPYRLVEAGQMIATVKIIPFAVREEIVARACEREEEAPPLLTIAAVREKRVALVMTTLPGVKESQLELGRKSQRARVERLGGALVEEGVVPHDQTSVTDAIEELAPRVDVLLVLGASAIVDREDVIPAAVEAAGGAILHLGMPVDPGNLLLLARRGDLAIVGVPGCARSLKRSGFDFVLERIFCDVPMSREDITKMGAGGLLAETPGRPSPRLGARANPAEFPGDRAPSVAAIVLAAGSSRRMGKENKLLLPVEGTPMIARVVAAACASNASRVVVVLGHEADRVRLALSAFDVTFVENAAHEEGLGASLRAGVRALGDEDDAVAVLLGDMPWVQNTHIDAVIGAFDPESDRSICVPVHGARRGHPVLFAARHFEELATLGGDSGARRVISAHEDSVTFVPLEDAAILRDVDTKEMLG